MASKPERCDFFSPRSHASEFPRFALRILYNASHIHLDIPAPLSGNLLLVEVAYSRSFGNPASFVRSTSHLKHMCSVRAIPYSWFFLATLHRWQVGCQIELSLAGIVANRELWVWPRDAQESHRAKIITAAFGILANRCAGCSSRSKEGLQGLPPSSSRSPCISSRAQEISDAPEGVPASVCGQTRSRRQRTEAALHRWSSPRTYYAQARYLPTWTRTFALHTF